MPDQNTSQDYQFKSEKEQLITLRDSLKLDLEVGHLSNTERLETAQEIDQLNEQIKAS